VTTNLLALKLAEDGVGVTIIDSFTASRAPGKVRILQLSAEVPVEIRWMRRVQAKLSHAVRRFVQILGAEATRFADLNHAWRRARWACTACAAIQLGNALRRVFMDPLGPSRAR
jgi:hypothetical protein